MSVEFYVVSEDYAGQRLDNFLFLRAKGVPKSRIYRAIRKGEVRINKKRCKAESRLQSGDEVRVPPLRKAEAAPVRSISDSLKLELESRILIETSDYLFVHKPSGIPVHGGSGVSLGLIEALRQSRPQNRFLELVHRLDKETSGCLLVAKKRSALVKMQDWFREHKLKKRYWVLVKGHWDRGRYRCDLPLIKNHLQSGERMVKVDRNGKSAITVFRSIVQIEGCTLLEATLKTGRTHQIRVHLQALGYPIAGDGKYGDREFNQVMRRIGLKRLFLQCMELSYRDHEQFFGCCALLDDDLRHLLSKLSQGSD